ncbi:MAG TPA: lysylphosphatidylglycerol synthase transmembrane domain-containing protein [Acidimicrobiales bacterium]
MTGKRRRLPPGLRRLVTVLLFFLVLHYLLVPQLSGARSSIKQISDLNPLLIFAGVLAEVGSLCAYAQLARTLIPRAGRPSFATVLRVQLATLATSHVVPGGSAAGTALGYRLFRRSGVAAVDAGFLLGALGVGSAAVLSALLWAALVISIPFRGANPEYVGAAIVGAVIVGGFGLIVIAMSRGSAAVDRLVGIAARHLHFIDPDSLSAFLHDLVERFQRLATQPKVVLRAVAWALLQWLADAASLWIFLAALGVHLAPDALIISFGLANMSAAIPLTPGGIGIYEAVLTSSLVGFGVPRAQALIAVLAYRFFAFWLPIPIGAVAYLSAEAAEPAERTVVLDAAYAESSSQVEDPRSWIRRHGLRMAGRPGADRGDADVTDADHPEAGRPEADRPEG